MSQRIENVVADINWIGKNNDFHLRMSPEEVSAVGSLLDFKSYDGN
jgi:hypothetical protein